MTKRQSAHAPRSRHARRSKLRGGPKALAQPVVTGGSLRLTYDELTSTTARNRNRSGHVTPEQAWRIRQMLRQNRASIVTGLAGLACLLVVFATALPNSGLFTAGAGRGAAIVEAERVVFVVVFLLSAGGLLTWVGRALRGLWLAEADLREKRIAERDGTVAWGRGHYRLGMYIARVGTRRLLSPAYGLPLPPGPYRCFYLDRSGWLLAAEPLPSAGASAALQDVISRQHGFSEGDVEANRGGQLSERQRRALRAQGLRRGALGLCLGGLGCLFALRLLPGSGVQSLADFIVAAFWTLACGGGGAALLAHAAHVLGEAGGPGAVGAVEGALGVRYKRTQRLIKVFYDLGGTSLELSERMAWRHAANSVIEGRRYRVYYRKQNNQVLSLEPVGHNW